MQAPPLHFACSFPASAVHLSSECDIAITLADRHCYKLWWPCGWQGPLQPELWDIHRLLRVSARAVRQSVQFVIMIAMVPMTCPSIPCARLQQSQNNIHEPQYLFKFDNLVHDHLQVS